eukprot:COSAG01_NODE_370_length_18018_cov_142.063620_8_plen_276_part_00
MSWCHCRFVHVRVLSMLFLGGFGSSISMVGRDGNQIMVDSPFEDEETRQFYEKIPELRAIIPAVFFGEGGAAAAAAAAAAAEDVDSAENGAGDAEADAEPEAGEEAIQLDIGDEIVVEDLEDVDAGGAKDDDDEDDVQAPKLEEDEAGEDEASSESAKIEALLSRLPECTNRQRMDDWAAEFCYMNSKRNRSRLLNALYRCNRNQLEVSDCAMMMDDDDHDDAAADDAAADDDDDNSCWCLHAVAGHRQLTIVLFLLAVCAILRATNCHAQPLST